MIISTEFANNTIHYSFFTLNIRYGILPNTLNASQSYFYNITQFILDGSQQQGQESRPRIQQKQSLST